MGAGTIDAELAAAREELRGGAVARATARLEDLRARAPDHPRVAAGLAQAYLRAGRLEAALAVAGEAARQAPTSYHVLVALGRARKAAHDLEGAREALSRARAALDTPYVATQLGRVLLGLGEGAAALDAARAARRRHGEDASLLALEGDALRRLGRDEEATAAYTAAQKLAPDDPLAHKRLLEARLRELDDDAALAELDALTQVPAYATRAYLFELRARRLHEAGRHAEAALTYERVLALEPDNAYAYKQLGFAASRAGDFERAAAALRPAFLADPGDLYVRRTILGALRKLDRQDEARALLDEVIATHPSVWALRAERRRLDPPEVATPSGPPPRRTPRRGRPPAAERTPELPGLGGPSRSAGRHGR